MHSVRVRSRQIIVLCFYANKITEGKNVLK